MTNYKEDLMQEGYMELWRTANNYDDRNSAEFSSYAVSCIKGKMMWYLNKNVNAVKPPEELIKTICKVKKKYGSLADAPKDVDKLVSEFKISRYLAQGVIDMQESTISLDAEIKDSEAETTIGDLYCISSEDAGKNVEKKLMLEQFVNEIDTQRNRYIFLKVLDGASYTDISKSVGITYRQVGRIAKKLCSEYLAFIS